MIEFCEHQLEFNYNMTIDWDSCMRKVMPMLQIQDKMKTSVDDKIVEIDENLYTRRKDNT